MTNTQIRALEKFRKELGNFLQSSYRNLYVTSGRSISVYTRKGVHRVDGKTRKTLDIANISINRPGKGLGMKTVDLMHEMNPFEITYIESILNEGFKERLLKEGWLIVQDAQPACVYKERN